MGIKDGQEGGSEQEDGHKSEEAIAVTSGAEGAGGGQARQQHTSRRDRGGEKPAQLLGENGVRSDIA